MAQSLLSGLLGRIGRRRASPTETLGTMGTAVYGGYPESPEDNVDLRGDLRWKTYSEILANVSIVAAGVRYFLNLAASARWSMEPSEADTDGRWAEMAEQILLDDPRTPWHRVVRRACMMRFYGFSVQEWTARRRDDGVLTFADIAPRAQKTIERWDVDVLGDVLGVLQRSPQTQEEIYLPRQKLLYVVDDTLSDSPEGLGLFRHLAAPAKRLRRYEQLEGVGFETDLRGVPVGYGPFTKLAEMVKSGRITKKDREQLEKPVRDFVQNHIRNPHTGLLFDSQPYESQDEAQRPSSMRQWSLELLKAPANSLPENADAINRVNREMARILGVEQLLLGEGSAASRSLSHDKTQSFFLLVDGTLRELEEAVKDDLVRTAWQLNGWPEEMMPKPSHEAVRFRDVEEIAGALRDMATAGAVLDPRDPAVGEVRDLLGLSRPDPELMNDLDPEDSSLTGNGRRGTEGEPDEEGGMPTDETQGGSK